MSNETLIQSPDGKAKFVPSDVEWIAEKIIAAGLDRIEARSEVPDGDPYGVGVIRETTGMALAVLYAQLTGDGMEIEGVFDRVKGGFVEAFSGPAAARKAQEDGKAARWATEFAALVTGAPKPCKHMTGQWIQRGISFRCYECGFQFFRAEIPKVKGRKIETWKPGK